MKNIELKWLSLNWLLIALVDTGIIRNKIGTCTYIQKLLLRILKGPNCLFIDLLYLKNNFYKDTLNLIQYAGYTPIIESFTQNTLTSNGALVTINVKYSSECVKGFDFVYSDGTTIATGFTDFTDVVSLSLSATNRLYAVSSYRGAICDTITFQTVETTSGVVSTFYTGNYGGRTANYFVNTANLLNILSFSGTYYLWTTGCLEDFSLSYSLPTSNFLFFILFRLLEKKEMT
jgi:hypothetical protein